MQRKRYFNLNIKHPNWESEPSAIEYWLQSRRQAPVFFGDDSVEDIMAGVIRTPLKTSAKNEMLRFLNITKTGKLENFDPIIVTIGSGFAWIYRLVGEPKSGERFVTPRKKKEALCDVPKFYEVDFIRENIPLAEVPYILSSMKANQAFSRSTFREIRSISGDERASYKGNIAAIESLTGWDPGFNIDPIECISSVEFETLVAKIFENNGFFVPAHRGGVLKDVDLFAYLENKNHNKLFDVSQDQGISIQLKLEVRNQDQRKHLARWLESSKTHFLITLETSPSKELQEFFNEGRYVTRDWVAAAVSRSPAVDHWLSRSTSWLPNPSWS